MVTCWLWFVRAHLCIADRYQSERQKVSNHKGAHHVDFPLVFRPDLPAEGVVVLPLHDALVVRNGSCHDHGQCPDQHHSEHGMPLHPDRGGFSSVDDGHVTVHGHCWQSENTDQHRHGEEIVDKFANERSEHPRRQHVDGGLERDAEEEVGQVSHAQVEDEYVGCASRLSGFTARQHGYDQCVPKHTKNENESKY